MIKGVIFDFNGTVILDKYAQIDAWFKAIKELCHHDLTMDEYNKYVYGVLGEDAFSHFLNRKLSYEESIRFVNAKEKIYQDLCTERKDTVTLANGLETFLDYLVANNYKVTIATGAPLTNMEYAFKNYGLNKWFSLDKIILNDGTIKGKPDPDIYLRAMDLIDLKPEECMAFEDSVIGLKAVISSGIRRVYLVDPYKERKDKYIEVMNQKVQIVTDFKELYDEIYK